MPITSFFPFDPTPAQTTALQQLEQFTKSSTDKVFILKGYAGTGKTTLMSGFIKWLNDKEELYAQLASTGRAAKVLRDKTGEKAYTIHSTIYVFSDLDDDLEAMAATQNEFVVDDKGQISLVFEVRVIKSDRKRIYIIDEASMVSDITGTTTSFAKFGTGKLLRDLFAFDPNGKFVFVGDPVQLPPVGQQISPALSKEYIENKYNFRVKQYELTDIIRQDTESSIIKASFLLRKQHATNLQVKFATFKFNGFQDVKVHNSHVNLVNEYISIVKEHGFDHTTLICQTNRHCADLNRIIRAAFGKNENQLEKGDILMVTQNNYIANLVNGDIVEVVATGKRELRCGLNFLNVQVKEIGGTKIHNILLIEDILYSVSTNLDNKQHKDLMIDYYFRMKDLGIKQKSQLFKDRMFFDPYLNALKAVYGYALTCHKAQGGEWNEVFLYIDNKIHGIPKPGIYQWMYTAVTRAKKKLHIVNDWFIK